MKKEIRRLRLQPGDILVVRHSETAKRLMALPGKHPFPVPIVVTAESVHRLSREYLVKLLASTEHPEATTAGSAAESQ